MHTIKRRRRPYQALDHDGDLEFRSESELDRAAHFEFEAGVGILVNV